MSEIMKDTNFSEMITLTNRKTGSIHVLSGMYPIYFCFGFIIIPLVFRLLFKSIGMSQSSSFVRFIYGLTGVYVLPFDGMLAMGISQGLDTTSVLEPATLIATTAFVLFAWGIVKLARFLSMDEQD